MRKGFILITVVLSFLCGHAWAADEVVIEELQTDVSVTKTKADQNAVEIQNLNTLWILVPKGFHLPSSLGVGELDQCHLVISGSEFLCLTPNPLSAAHINKVKPLDHQDLLHQREG